MKSWDRLRWSVARQFYQAKKALPRLRIGDRCIEANGFRHRQYPDYETYLEHQRTKYSALRLRSVEKHDRRFHAALAARLQFTPLAFGGTSGLCLGARQGSEVRAFIDRGAFAIRIDLRPGGTNKYVVVGDFHDLQLANGSVDYVYSNSLDHAFDLERVLGEVGRVLKSSGAFIVELNASSDGAAAAGPYEATVWSDTDRVVQVLAARGFAVENRRAFTEPWIGEQIILRAKMCKGRHSHEARRPE